MGDIVPFRKKPSWTRPEDYGHLPQPPQFPKKGGGGRPPRPSRWKKWLPLLFWLAVVTGLSWWVAGDPLRVEPPSFLEGEPEPVSGKFTLCGTKGSANCVVDGDTIRIGKRTIRIVGIDAPETRDAQCAMERRMGEAAAGALLALVNQGPFEMVGRIDDPRDEYGRELRALVRRKADGSEQSIASDLVSAGMARSYIGGSREPWCPAPV